MKKKIYQNLKFKFDSFAPNMPNLASQHTFFKRFVAIKIAVFLVQQLLVIIVSS